MADPRCVYDRLWGAPCQGYPLLQQWGSTSEFQLFIIDFMEFRRKKATKKKDGRVEVKRKKHLGIVFIFILFFIFSFIELHFLNV